MFQPTVTSKRPVSGGSSKKVDGECGAKLGLVLLDAAKTSVEIKDTRFSERVIATSFEEKNPFISRRPEKSSPRCSKALFVKPISKPCTVPISTSVGHP